MHAHIGNLDHITARPNLLPLLQYSTVYSSSRVCTVCTSKLTMNDVVATINCGLETTDSSEMWQVRR